METTLDLADQNETSLIRLFCEKDEKWVFFPIHLILLNSKRFQHHMEVLNEIPLHWAVPFTSTQIKSLLVFMSNFTLHFMSCKLTVLPSLLGERCYETYWEMIQWFEFNSIYQDYLIHLLPIPMFLQCMNYTNEQKQSKMPEIIQSIQHYQDENPLCFYEKWLIYSLQISKNE